MTAESLKRCRKKISPVSIERIKEKKETHLGKIERRAEQNWSGYKKYQVIKGNL